MYRILLSLILATACTPTYVYSPPPTPTPEPVVVTYSCNDACENQRRLGCELGKPNPKDGTTCEETCRVVDDLGIAAVAWDKEKLTTAERCEDAKD